MERTRDSLRFINKFPLSFHSPRFIENARNSLKLRLKSFLLALLAPDLWSGQEIHFGLYISFLLALLAPALWRGQEIQFSLYLSLYKFPLSMKLSSALLLAFIAPDL